MGSTELAEPMSIVGSVRVDEYREQRIALRTQLRLIRGQIAEQGTAIAAFPEQWRGRLYVMFIEPVKKSKGKQLLLRFFVLNRDEWTVVPNAPSIQCLEKKLESAFKRMYAYYGHIEEWFVDPINPNG